MFNRKSTAMKNGILCWSLLRSLKFIDSLKSYLKYENKLGVFYNFSNKMQKNILDI